MTLLALSLIGGYWLLSGRDTDRDATGPEAAAAATAPSATATADRADPAPVEGSPVVLPPLLKKTIRGDPRQVDHVGRFFADHVQQDVRVDTEWFTGGGSLSADEAGHLEVLATCFPGCDINQAHGVQGIVVTIEGLQTTSDVTFSGIPETNWRMIGTFFVQGTSIETGGVYHVRLRVSGTAEPGSSPPEPVDQPAQEPGGRCDALDGKQLAYPGAALSTADSGQYSPHVQLVQDVLNFQGEALPSLRCIPEDGYFGPATHEELREYQRSVGLPPDGIVDEATYEALMLTFE